MIVTLILQSGSFYAGYLKETVIPRYDRFGWYGGITNLLPLSLVEAALALAKESHPTSLFFEASAVLTG